LCWFCVAPERTGHPRSQRSAEQAFTLDADRVTVASARLGQLSICAYLLLARTHRQPVIDGRSQSVTHGMGVREQITAQSPCRFRARSELAGLPRSSLQIDHCRAPAPISASAAGEKGPCERDGSPAKGQAFQSGGWNILRLAAHVPRELPEGRGVGAGLGPLPSRCEEQGAGRPRNAARRAV
jgi:hypothetical protein